MEVSVSPQQQQADNDFHNLPGFRFHPTEEELLGFYLKKMVQGKLSSHIKIIRVLELYRYDPWDLPGLAGLGGREWFFFVPRDRKVSRPNRLTVSGYWKASGSDKQILDAQAKCIGFKRTLVFYRGRSPCGRKTDWIMNEYRMPGLQERLKKNDVVLCRVYRKAVSLKSIELRAMAEMGEQSGLEGCLDHSNHVEEKRIAAEPDYTKIEAQNCPKDGNLTSNFSINHSSPSTKSPKCEDTVEHGVISSPLSTNFCDDIEGKTPIELESFMEHELGIKEANTEKNSMDEYNPLWSPTGTPATWCHSLSFSDSQHPQEVMGWMYCI